MPPKLIRHNDRVYMLVLADARKKSLLPIALEGKYNMLIVRFGKTHGLYVEADAPQLVQPEQVEETFFGKGKR